MRGSSRQLSYKHRKILRFLSLHTNMFMGKRVLDAGGRDGLIINKLSGAKWRVILDLDKSELAKAKTSLKIVADIGHLPFIEDSFDLTMFSEVLEHVEKPQQVVKDLARVCRYILMTTPNNSIFRRVLWRIRRKGSLSSPGHVCEYSPKEIKHFFRNAGFGLIMFEGIGFIIGKPKFLNIFEVLPYFSSKVLMLFEKRCGQLS